MSTNTSFDKISPNGIYLLIKIIRPIVLIFLCTRLAQSGLTNSYTEQVLVNDKDPPPLTNFVFIIACMDTFFVLIYLFFGWMCGAQPVDLITIATDLVFSLILNIYILWMIANTMHNKKYFLYKDDGLRAIRALRDISVHVIIGTAICPLGLCSKYMGFSEQLTK